MEYKWPRVRCLLIEAYSQYTKYHCDMLTLKSLYFLPYDFGRIWVYIFILTFHTDCT